MGVSFSRPSDVSQIERIYDKQLQRQIVIASDVVAEREALARAHRRNVMLWELLGGCAFGIMTLFYSAKTKNKIALLPIAPVLMLVGFHADQTTDDYWAGVRKTAEELLRNDRNNLRLPGGPITLAELDERRERWKTGLKN